VGYCRLVLHQGAWEDLFDMAAGMPPFCVK
jgi:hypothetical protein